MNAAGAANVRSGGAGGFFPNAAGGAGVPAGGSDKNNSRLFNNAHYGGAVVPGGVEYQNTLLGNSPSAILNNGLNPLAAPVVAPNAAGGNGPAGVVPTGAGVPHHPQGVVPAGGVQQVQQQGPPTGVPAPAYYVQQAVYLDQNGQPIFYRPGKLSSSFFLSYYLLVSL